ncbi:ABC transporter substrate-binding protein [Massilia sp. W12]|uniref:ABC transporter substrate-binding protein n=2 Tax=Massilia sp. W12 TaxID=3126507 RepID=UPI0030CD2BD8
MRRTGLFFCIGAPMNFSGKVCTRIFSAVVGLLAALPSFAENGVTERKIILGQSAAFSGPAAQLGIHMHAGASVYFENLNEDGGVHGRKIEIVTADDKYEAKLAEENTIKLIEKDQVFALFGYVGTPTSAAALPIFTKEKVPFFAPFTGAQLLREPFNRYIFNMRSSYYDETEHLVNHLVKNGMSKIAVFYQNDSYGMAGLKGVERAMEKMKVQLVAKSTVERNSVDVSKALRDILPRQPDVIIQISAYASCAAFIVEAKKQKYNGQFYNVSFVGSQALADTLAKSGPDYGPGVVISQVVPFPWSQATPVVAEYTKAMRKAKKEINFSSLEGYMAAKIFHEGLRRAGRELTREKLIRALESINSANYDVGGFAVNFSPSNHNASRYVDMTVIMPERRFAH